MRPNQNNKNRQRGRNNNGGRKHVNPLSRNFESNGPDVKVRGNAAHVAEKYLQLARDAQSSGDPVLAENYLQHAEHYFRIVAAAQPQNQFRDQAGQVQEVDEDDDFPPINDRFASPELQRFSAPQQPQNEPQPGLPAEGEESSGSEAAPAAPAAPAEAVANGEDGQPLAAEGEGDGHRRRERSRRRRSRGPAEGTPGSDPGEAPQPDVGELPAFLTATSAAEEGKPLIRPSVPFAPVGRRGDWEVCSELPRPRCGSGARPPHPAFGSLLSRRGEGMAATSARNCRCHHVIPAQAGI